MRKPIKDEFKFNRTKYDDQSKSKISKGFLTSKIKK